MATAGAEEEKSPAAPQASPNITPEELEQLHLRPPATLGMSEIAAAAMNSEWVMASFEAGRYEETVSKFVRLETQNPACINAELLNAKGLALLRLGRALEAATTFRDVLDKWPDDPIAKANFAAAGVSVKRIELERADNMFQQGRFERALKSYHAIVLDDDDSPELRFSIQNNAGACLVQLGRVDEALAAFNSALEVKPNHLEALHNKATVLKVQERFAEALAAFDTCLAVRADFYSALCGKCETLTAMTRFEEAEEVATSAIVSNHEDYRAYSDRGFARLKMHKYEEAVNDFEMSRVKGDMSHESYRLLRLALSLLGDECSKKGNHEAAVVSYEKALAMTGSADAPNPNLLFNHALGLLHTGRHDEAIAGFRSVIEVDSEHGNAHAALGLVLLQDENFADALSSLQEAFRIRSDDADTLYNIGVCQLQLERFEAASASFRRLLGMDPTHELGIHALSVVESHLSLANARTNGETAPQRSPTPRSPASPEGGTDPRRLSRRHRASITAADVQDSIAPLSPGVFVEMKFPLAALQAPGPYPEGVNPTEREKYLNDEDFAALLGDRAQFESLPRWKRVAKKREHGLF